MAKKIHPLIRQDTRLDSVNVEWGQWTNVPKADSLSFVCAIADYQTNLSYSLRKMVFKGALVFIEYEMNDGRILHYRFLKHFAAAGLLANPLYLDQKNNKQSVKRIRFLNEGRSYFSNKVKVVWDRVQMIEKNSI